MSEQLPDKIKRRKRFFIRLERRAGLSIAIPLVTLALFILNIIVLPPRQENEPIPMKIMVEMAPLAEPPPPPEPEPVPPPEEEEKPIEEPEPEMRPVAATRVDSSEEGTEITDPVEKESEEEPTEQIVVREDPLTEQEKKEPATLRDWIPTLDDAVEVAQLREIAQEQSATLDQKAKEIREYIIMKEVQSAAKDFELNSDGGLDGAIRTLDIEGFPENVVIKVLKKHGITYERRFISPAGGRQYLNAAVTAQGTFRNIQKKGYYDVMVLSNRATTYMATREIEALQDRGYDPRTARVRKIVFGIILDEVGEYNLGVTDLEVEQIR